MTSSPIETDPDPSQTERTYVLSDAPTDLDAFGGHARVAKALADVIEHEPGGRTIGLDGSWGSGKSTVVRLLEGSLSEDVDVFVFDTWAHEGDPLRRSFLEALISHLVHKGWLEKGPWEEEAERLAKRRRETDTDSDQHLTTNGKWITGSVLLVPIGTAILNWALGQRRINPLELLAGAIVTIAPLLVALILVLAAKQESKRKTKGSDPTPSTSPLSIFGESSTTRQRTLTIETADPTSIEFERVFNRLLEAALSDDGRRLLIVLDNLDRVGAEITARTLATLQTFVGLGNRCAVSDRYWVLLPYDRRGFEKLWNSAVDQQLDKICQLRFYVPPVLTSDWRSYLGDQLGRAMPSRRPEEIDDALAVAIALQIDRVWPTAADGGGGGAPAPRDMVLIANDVGALNRQRPELPLGALTYYAALRRTSIGDLGDRLVAGDVPSQRLRSILGSEASDTLAAIHFNVSVDQSKQIVLGEPVSLALRRGDAPALLQMSQYEGFWEVLRTLPYSDWAEGSSDLGNAGAAIEGAGLLDTALFPVLRAIGDAIVSSDEPWSMSSHAIGRGFGQMLIRSGHTTEVGNVLSKIALDASGTSRRAHIAAADGLVGFIAVLPDGRPPDSTVVVRGSAEEFLGFCEVVSETDPAAVCWDVIRASASRADVTASVIAWAGQAPDRPRTLGTLAVAQRAQAFDVEAVLSAFLAHLQSTVADGSAASMFAFQIVDRLASDKAEVFQPLVDDGSLLDLVNAFATADQHAPAARCIIRLLCLAPKVPEPPAKGNSPAGAALVRDLLQLGGAQELTSAVQAELGADEAQLAFVIGSKAGGGSPLVAEAVKSQAADALGASRIATSWRVLTAVLPAETLEDLVRGSAAELFERDDSPTALLPSLRDRLFHVALMLSDESTAVDYVSKINDRLRALTEEQWVEALVEREHPTELLMLSLDAGQSPSLGAAFQEALIELSERVQAGTFNPEPDYGRLPNALAADHHRHAVAAKVMDLMAGAGEGLRGELVDVMGDLLSREDSILHDGRLLGSVAPDAVRSRNAKVLTWLTGLLDGHRELLNDDASVANLSDLVQATLDGSDDEMPELRALASQLGVDTVPETDTVETDAESGTDD